MGTTGCSGLDPKLRHAKLAVRQAKKLLDLAFQALIAEGLAETQVRELADQIIESQMRGIAETQLLIDNIEQNGERARRRFPPTLTK